MKPVLKAPGTKRLKLKYDEPLSNFAFKCNLHRYIQEVMYNCGKCGFIVGPIFQQKGGEETRPGSCPECQSKVGKHYPCTVILQTAPIVYRLHVLNTGNVICSHLCLRCGGALASGPVGHQH